MAQARLTREAKRQQTRERLLAAATAEFGRAGMAAADIATIVAEAGVAHSTFFFHFPTKEHVLLELEAREERLMADRLDDFLATSPDLGAALHKAVDLLAELRDHAGTTLFRDFLARTSPQPAHLRGGTRTSGVPHAGGTVRRCHPRRCRRRGSRLDELRLLLPDRAARCSSPSVRTEPNAMLDDYVSRTLRSLQPPR